MKTRLTLTALTLASTLMAGTSAMADTKEGHFNVYIKLTGTCETLTMTSGESAAISNSNPNLAGADINFGTHKASSTASISNQANAGGMNNGIGIKCSKNTPFTVALEPQNVADTTGYGTMKVIDGSHSDTIRYQLYKPTVTGNGLTQQIVEQASTDKWGSDSNVLSLTGQGFNNEIKLPVYASIASGELDKYVSEYQDRVKVTLSY